MKKLIEFGELTEEIQQYANEEYEGNFTMAVRILLKKALISHEMKRGHQDEDH